MQSNQKWNPGHFPVGTRVIAGINEKSMREYVVSYLMQTDVRSYVIQTNEPHEEIGGMNHSINIDHVQQILKRGDGAVVIRKPMWDHPKSSNEKYGLDPRDSLRLQLASSEFNTFSRRTRRGFFPANAVKESTAEDTKKLDYDEFQVCLNRDLKKGRGEYHTGRPEDLVRALLGRMSIEGVVESEELTKHLIGRGVFYRRTLQGFTYYGANKKKLKRAIGQSLNKCKVKIKTVEKELSLLDEDFKLNNPFSEDFSRRFSPTEIRQRIQNREKVVSSEDGLSHYDDYDDRSHADHDQRDWDRLLKDI